MNRNTTSRPVDAGRIPEDAADRVPASAPRRVEEADAAVPDHSLARLLKLVLGVEDRLPVHATPSLADWAGAEESRAWPPGDGVPSLCLIDTRDRAAWADSSPLVSGSRMDGGALFILTGSGGQTSPLRRLLRYVQQPGTRRHGEATVRRVLKRRHAEASVYRLGFADGAHVPVTFRTTDTASTGAALVVVDRAPFGGGIWKPIRLQLGDPHAMPREIHLRARGAAVAIMDTRDGAVAVRIVPPGPLQDVVHRNHVALAALRDRLNRSQHLLERIPRPMFAHTVDGVLLMAETCVTGRLAWTVDRGALRPVLLRNAHAFLDALRAATTRTTTLDRSTLQRLLQQDRQMLERSPFVEPEVAAALRAEMEHAIGALANRDAQLHASHGDFGYGNVLVSPDDGSIGGVIDWDTARIEDLPGIDRVNLEIQVLRRDLSFSSAVERVWSERLAHPAFLIDEPVARRALFALALVRYMTRAMSYPALYATAEPEFRRALRWLVATQ